MKTVKDWVSGLKISAEKYQSWLSEAPADESFTFWCLQTGRIPQDEYTAWARDYYGLPSLGPEFFAQGASTELWTAIQGVANWSAAMVPIAQWDNVVYIACVEPTDVKWSFPVQQVLASAKDLKQFWQTLVMTEERSFASIPPTPDKQTSEAEPPALLADEPSGLTLTAFKAPPTPVLNDEETLAPDGFLNLSNATGDSVVAAPIPDPLASAPAVTAADPLTISPDPLELAADALAPVEVAPADVIIGDDTMNAPVGFDAPSNLPLNKGPAGLSEPPTLTVVPKRKESGANEPSVGTTTSTVTRFHTQFLSSMATKFSGSMIIEISKDNFLPIIWNESFRPQSDRAKKVWNLNPPSAFRIAFRTGQPYLGHVVETPANTDFFKEWGFKDLPKCILVQPVKNSSGQVTHLLLGLATDQAHPHQMLGESEKLAAEFSSLIGAQKSAA